MLGTFTGAQPFYNDAVAATVVQVKSGRGLVAVLKIINTNASAAYLQMFGLVSTAVTLGTTAPDAVIPLAASEAITIPLTEPIQLGQIAGANAGISIAGTTTATGNTGVAVGLKVFVAYQ